MAANPLKGWQIDRSTLDMVGKDLRRPECVLAERDGTLWSADARGGVVKIDKDGTQRLITPAIDARFDGASASQRLFERGNLPNGMAFDRDGNFVIANFGTDALETMTRDGKHTTICTEIDGQPLGKANFVLTDSKGRIWFTVTTRLNPWTRCVFERTPDGYVGVLDEKGARIVADGFVGTNEIRFDAKEEWLYVVETNARRISRLRARDDGTLTDREVYGPSDLGGFPDGFAFDAYGNLWIAMVMNDRIQALTPEGDLLTLLDDGNPEANAALEKAYQTRTMTQEIMQACGGKLATWMASITFGGPDLCDFYIGSLLGNTLPHGRSPVPGLAMSHWK